MAQKTPKPENNPIKITVALLAPHWHHAAPEHQDGVCVDLPKSPQPHPAPSSFSSAPAQPGQPNPLPPSPPQLGLWVPERGCFGTHKLAPYFLPWTHANLPPDSADADDARPGGLEFVGPGKGVFGDPQTPPTSCPGAQFPTQPSSPGFRVFG